jgi:hypothetical protein
MSAHRLTLQIDRDHRGRDEGEDADKYGQSQNLYTGREIQLSGCEHLRYIGRNKTDQPERDQNEDQVRQPDCPEDGKKAQERKTIRIRNRALDWNLAGPDDSPSRPVST